MQRANQPPHQSKKSDVQMAYVKTNYAMHDAMKVALTGDADIDFAKSMVPHHEGAVEMAKIVLEHGDDPKMRALAESVIRVQEAEIAFLKEWLKENPKEET